MVPFLFMLELIVGSRLLQLLHLSLGAGLVAIQSPSGQVIAAVPVVLHYEFCYSPL